MFRANFFSSRFYEANYFGQTVVEPPPATGVVTYTISVAGASIVTS